jgi:hypothetical protein
MNSSGNNSRLLSNVFTTLWKIIKVIPVWMRWTFWIVVCAIIILFIVFLLASEASAIAATCLFVLFIISGIILLYAISLEQKRLQSDQEILRFQNAYLEEKLTTSLNSYWNFIYEINYQIKALLNNSNLQELPESIKKEELSEELKHISCHLESKLEEFASIQALMAGAERIQESSARDFFDSLKRNNEVTGEIPMQGGDEDDE